MKYQGEKVVITVTNDMILGSGITKNPQNEIILSPDSVVNITEKNGKYTMTVAKNTPNKGFEFSVSKEGVVVTPEKIDAIKLQKEIQKIRAFDDMTPLEDKVPAISADGTVKLSMRTDPETGSVGGAVRNVALSMEQYITKDAN